MSADLNVEKLRSELHEISQQKFEVNERLRNWGGRGRGGQGWPAPDARAAQVGGPGRGYLGPNGRGPSYQDARSSDARDQRGEKYRSWPREPSGQEILPAAPAPAPKRLMSAIVIGGQARTPRAQPQGLEQPFPDVGAPKRPAPAESAQNPAAQKRARRLFGSLLGTLAKASAEEDKFQETGAAQKRQEAMQRVREREREERQRSRQVAREKELAERQAEVNRKRELTALAEVKRLEIMAAESFAHRELLANFIRTRAGPPLHWLPAVHTPATEELLEQQQALLADWKAQQLAKLEEDKAQLLAARAPSLLPRKAEGTADDADGAEPGEVGDAPGEAAAAEAADAEGARDSAENGGDAGRWQTSGAAAEDADDRWQDTEADDTEAAMAMDSRGEREAETLQDLLS